MCAKKITKTSRKRLAFETLKRGAHVTNTSELNIPETLLDCHNYLAETLYRLREERYNDELVMKQCKRIEASIGLLIMVIGSIGDKKMLTSVARLESEKISPRAVKKILNLLSEIEGTKLPDSSLRHVAKTLKVNFKYGNFSYTSAGCRQREKSEDDI